MSDLNNALEKIYQDNSKVDNHSKGTRKLLTYIKEVVEEVGKTNPRFRSSNIENVTSPETNDALHSTESDHLVILKIRGKEKDIPESPGNAKFEVDSSAESDWTDCINTEGYLEPKEVIAKYKECIHSAVKVTQQELSRDWINDIKVDIGDAAAMTITASYSPVRFTLKRQIYTPVKCDLNLIIGCCELPPIELSSWLYDRSSQSKRWPSSDTVEKIWNTFGFGLVAQNLNAEVSNIRKTETDLQLLWQYSVSRAETCILQHCTADLIHKKLLIILKVVLLVEIHEGSDRTPLLTSYHIKTIVFHEAHDYPDPDSWKQNKLGERYKSALKRLQKSICENHLPHFFFPNVNLFKGPMKSMLEGIIERPHEHLQNLMTEVECQKQLRLNAALEKFYLEKAFGHQIDEYTEFKHYIENALQEVAKKYPRFRSSKVELVGSSATDVFALLKKEMDLLLIFNIKGVITDQPDSPGFARFQVDPSVREDWEDCINNEGYLEPRRISSEFKKCFEWAVSNIKLKHPNDLLDLTDIEVRGGDSVAITIVGEYGQSSEIFGKVQCDLVLLIGFEGLPPTKLALWLNEKSSQIWRWPTFDTLKNIPNIIGFGLMVLLIGFERFPPAVLAPWFKKSSSQIKRWPTFDTVEKIRNTIGFGLVAKNVNADDSCISETAADVNLLWRYSVSRAETCILGHCQDGLIHKKLLIILKAVKMFEIPEGSNPTPPLTSYHMKTILLHEAHDFPDPNNWKEEKLAERYESALKRLLKSIEENHLPHFFFPNVNLFQGGQYSIACKIKEMIDNPIDYLEMLTVDIGISSIIYSKGSYKLMQDTVTENSYIYKYV